MSQNGHINKSLVFGDTFEAHKFMDAIWGPFINIAIFLVLYSYRKWWVYVHGIFGLFACIYTLATAIPILTFTGIVQSNTTLDPQKSGTILNAHYLIGISCLIVIVIQTLLGIATKLLNIFQANSNTILGIRKAHMVFGYIMIWLCKVDIYILGDFGGWLAQDLVFAALLIIRKYVFPTLEKTIAPKQETEPRYILSIKQLQHDKDYVVFANYVYDAQPLKINHPAGYQIIRAVRNKEVDRYMYGSEAAAELPEVGIYSHSYKSFTLMNQPVAKLNITSTYSGFESQEVQVNLESMSLISEKGRIYELSLKHKTGAFKFDKYTDITQLGRYYSISLNDKVTRLYTSVNFLCKQNKQFMMQNLEGLSSIEEKQIKINPIHSKTEIEMQKSGTGFKNIQEQNRTVGDEIPILIRTYPGGKFTQGVVNGPVQKLVISKPKGEGLQLTHLKAGRVIMVAGGTGLYPFSDFIDLLFKDQLAKDKPQLRNQIEQLSPVLRNKPFEKNTFELLAAFQNVQDIHPITLKQILYLSKHSVNFKLTLKIKEVGKELANQGKMRLVTGGFQQMLENQMGQGVAKVWLCGPPKMNEGVSLFLREKYKNPELYLIL